MVNMMREHVPQETRIHYVITDGGKAPNVVPEAAEVYYVARHPDIRVARRHLGADRQRREGSGARHRHDDGHGDHQRGVQRAAERLSRGIAAQRISRESAALSYTPEERAFAEQIRKTLSEPMLPLGSEAQIQPRAKRSDRSRRRTWAT